jgi:hypothetical protein
MGPSGPSGASPWALAGNNTFYNVGNVGIGGSGPNALLDVETADAQGAMIGSGNSVAVQQGMGAAIGFQNAATGGGDYSVAIGANNVAGGANSIALGESMTVGGNGTIGVNLGDPDMGPTGTTSADHAFVIMGGKVGIHNASPGCTLTVGSATTADDFCLNNGAAIGAQAWSQVSDARLKKNVIGIDGFLALRLLLMLRGVTFEWINPRQGEGPHYGMIAQEVEDIFPAWITNGHDGYKSLSYEGFQGLAVEAMRALQTENDEIKAANARLQAQYDELQTQNETLRSRLDRLEAAMAGTVAAPTCP